MKRASLLVILAMAPLVAQNALYLDLSGDWCIQTSDAPGFAEPALDDSSWRSVTLPWSRLPPGGVYWLRRTVLLPDPLSAEPLALTLGSVAEVYEVFVNGKPAKEIAEAAKAWGQTDDITVVTVRRTA